MDQQELRQWEARCIQEEAPQCQAACPLHVDVRAFTKLLAERRVDKAWTVLARTMPLPGVLARLCEGPCLDACIRAEAGGSICVPALERYCAQNAKPAKPPRPMRGNGKAAAVMGEGLTALTAAWELARRGFATTLYAPVPGAPLTDLPADVLPPEVLAHELEAMAALGVATVTDAALDAALLERLLAEADAVFVDGLTVPEALRPAEGPDPVSLGTGRERLFAGPGPGGPEEGSCILQAAVGRRAANSVERFTQGVSLVSGREKEGPYPTRLYTSLADVAPEPPLFQDPVTGPVDGEKDAAAEAARCIQCECMECVKVCKYLEHYGHYPKVYVRQIYNNESIVMGTRQANTMINSCMLCGLCTTVCPEDFEMAEVCLEARRSMVRRGKMPPSAHEFALRDMAFANGGHCALARHAPDTHASDYAFFPGCQLTASDPDAAARAYADLRERLGAVGLLLRCCAAPARWAGREDLAAQEAEALTADWEALGRPKLIAACPTCAGMLARTLPEAEVQTHWSVLHALGPPEGAKAPAAPLAVNDPCAARHEPVMRADVRALLEAVGTDTVEPRLGGELTQCCGFGGLLSEADPDLAETVREDRANAADEDFVTYCAMCRDMIAKTGKRSLHVYDLLYPSGEDDPGMRPAPGYSERRENRARLRERLLRELWGEADDAPRPEHEAVAVRFTDEAAQRMEQRRILVGDVQKVLLSAERTGKRFANADSGRLLACHRPVSVTYWVEYETDGEGYVVHNAWSHRMRVKEVS